MSPRHTVSAIKREIAPPVPAGKSRKNAGYDDVQPRRSVGDALRRGPGCRVSRRGAGPSHPRIARRRPRTAIANTLHRAAASRPATTSASTPVTGPSTSKRCSGAGSLARSPSTSTGGTSRPSCGTSIDDAELVAMIVEDEYLPAPRRARVRRSASAWATGPTSRRSRAFDDVPRSADDLYLLCTGGTTGMPKGVIWRHEDIYFVD